MSARTHLLTSLLLLALTPAALAKTAKVKICVPKFREEFLTLSILEAADKGLFKKNGLDVEIVPTRFHQKRSQLSSKAGNIPRGLVIDQGSAEQVAAQECQFGASVIENFIFTENTRAQVKPLFVSMYGQDYDTHLIVAKNSPIQSVKDLKGKKIRMGQLPTHIALHNMLKQEGLSMNDVQPEWRVEPAQVLAKLESGEIDAAMTYVPTMPYMLASGRVRSLKSNIVKNFVLPSVPHSLVIVNRAFAQAAPDVVKRFRTALLEATAQIERNPSDVIYTLQRNSSKIGFSEWKTDKLIAEKAAAFVGTVSAVDMSADAPARTAVVKAVADYSDLIQKLEYTATKADLKSWLTNDVPAQKIGAL